jgi:integrase
MRGGVTVYRPTNRGVASKVWSCDYPTPDGGRVRKSTGCTERAAALRVATEWFRAAQHAHADRVQGIERPSEIALVTLADDFIDAMRAEKAPLYVQSMEDHLRAYILPHFGPDSAAAEITREAVEGFRRVVLSGAITTKAARTRKGPGASASTANRILCCLPCRTSLRPGCADCHNGQRVAQWVRFMVATGVRRGEAETVQWADVDTTARTLLIHAKRAKGARTRRVPLQQEALAVLDELRADGPAVGLVWGKHDRRKTVAPAWKRTGLSGRAPTPHDYRHTCASRAAAAGLDLVQLMDWFGWKSVAVAQRYLHLYGGRWADMAAKMDAFANAGAGHR